MTYPTISPSLTLDFAKSKQLDPRIAFTRSSTGTYLDSDGLIKTAPSGVARFEYDSSGNALGLLMEESRTNYFFAYASPNYNNRSAVYATYSDSRFGADQNAHSWTFNTAESTAELGWFNPGSISTTGDGVQYTVSFWAKASQAYQLRGNLDDQRRNNVSFYFNLTTEWQYFTASTPAGVTDDGSGTVYFRWLKGSGITSIPAGLQLDFAAVNLEIGGFPTSFIPTSGSTVTRSADLATMPTAGIFGDEFTTINKNFGTVGGSDTLTIVGPDTARADRTVVYSANLTQAQINEVATAEDNDYWMWRVLGSSFALPNFSTNGQVTVDWGDGTVEVLTTAEHTFANGGGYHEIGFRLDSGTYFGPEDPTTTHKDKIISTGPAPSSMVLYGRQVFKKCSNLVACDATITVTDLRYGFQTCSSLKSVPFMDTSTVTDWSGAFVTNSSLTSFPPLDTSSGTGFNQTWSGCSSLTSFPQIDLSSATAIQYTWMNCSSLESFPFIDTSGITDFRQAWNNCSSLTSFPLIDTSSALSIQAAWSGCSGLTSFPLINTSSATNIKNAWANCSGLTSFPLIDTSSGTNFTSAWNGCSGLTSFSLIDTSSGTNFTSTWNGCSGLTSFPLINTSSGANFFSTWGGCTGLTSFPLIDVSSATTLERAWTSCTSLTSFPLLNTSSVTNFTSAWRQCESLATFPLIDTSSGTTFGTTWQNNISLTTFPALDFSSATTLNSAWNGGSVLANFPANMFDTTGTLVSDAFRNAWRNCALTAASIENILVSLDANGASNITLHIGGGTNVGQSNWTSAATTAYNNLVTKGWTISANS